MAVYYTEYIAYQIYSNSTQIVGLNGKSSICLQKTDSEAIEIIPTVYCWPSTSLENDVHSNDAQHTEPPPSQALSGLEVVAAAHPSLSSSDHFDHSAQPVEKAGSVHPARETFVNLLSLLRSLVQSILLSRMMCIPMMPGILNLILVKICLPMNWFLQHTPV
jgi:hypothetical protein